MLGASSCDSAFAFATREMCRLYLGWCWCWGSMRVWDCGDILHIVGVKVSCEIGGVFPVGEYEDGFARVVVSMGMGAVNGLFQRGR